MKNYYLSSLLLCSILLAGCGNNKISESSKESESTITSISVSNSSNEEKDIEKSIIDNDVATIFAAPNTVSIMKDVSIKAQCEFWGDEWLENTDKLHMEGIKGETEATQLMITAKNDINSFMLEVGDFVNKEDPNAVISSENVGVFAERYIEVKASSSTPKKACAFTGWYPDALIPIKSYKTRKENKIEKGMNQAIYVSVEILYGVKEGTYEATGKLNLDGTVLSIPFTLKVYNVSIPEVAHKRTALDIWGAQIGYGEIMLDEDDNPIDWYQRYYDFLVSKRLTPQAIANNSVGNAYANNVVKAAQNPKVTGYRLPYGSAKVSGITDTVCDYNSLVTQLTALANKNIELRESGDNTTDLFKKAYYYFASIIDEPSGSKYQAVRYCDKAVLDAKNEVAPLLAAYPDLQESLLNVPHVVTCKYDETLVGGVQTWCAQVQAYPSSVLEIIPTLKRSTDVYDIGENFWNYMTCDSNNPYPSFQLDDNLMSTRVLSWMDYDYEIDCTLFWNVCYYQKYTTSLGHVTRDIWTDPKSWVSANGDGYLLYPGSRYGLDTPIATLRLENFREGVEDYEYLYMLEDGINQIADSKGVEINFKEIMQKYYDHLYKHNTMVPYTNVNDFANVRKDILELLELVTNDPDSAYAQLTK